jgi:hypothetical protein
MYFHILESVRTQYQSALGRSSMKAGLIGAAAAALVLSGCYYYPGPYTYYPTVPAQAAGVETIPPNSPDYPQADSAQTAPASGQTAQQNGQQASPQSSQAPQQGGYNGGTVYAAPPPGYAAPPPGYACYPGYPCYPAYGYPAYGYGYPAYGGPVVYGGPAIGLGFSFRGHFH